MTRSWHCLKVAGLSTGIVLLLCGAWWYRSTQRAAGAAPRTAPAALTISALGRLEPHSRVIQLAAPGDAMNARVELLQVNEGDEVAAGAVIAVLDTNRQKSAALREAEVKVKVAEARLAQIRAGAKAGEIEAQTAAVSRLEAMRRTAQSDFDRYHRAGSGVNAAEMDRQKMEVERTRFELEQAKSTLTGLREVRAVDVRLQEQEIAAARAAVERATADRDTTTIRTPIAGRVLKIHTRPGARVGDRGLVEIGATERMDAVAEVYEADVPRVRIGQKATVRLRSSNQMLAGEVAEVGLLIGRKDVLKNDAVSDTDARVVEVRVRLTAADSRRVAGLTNARVEVEIAE